jgi:tetratricopeptide (TPR) repeat protein
MEVNISEYIKENKEKISKKFSTLIKTKKEESIYDPPEIFPGMIIQCKITKINYNNTTKKKNSIFCSLIKILSYIEYNNNISKEDFDKIIVNLAPYHISGIIKSENIYDNNLIYLNESINDNLYIGNEISALVIEVLGENIFLSLQNSIIKNYHQTFFDKTKEEYNIPYSLGQKILEISENLNDQYIENKLNEYGIKFEEKIDFPYKTIRKIQNYDWSDEYVNKAKEECEFGNFQKAIELYTEAEKLDPFSGTIYINKANIFLKLHDLESAKKNLKNLLKIEPNNQVAIDKLKQIIDIQIQNDNNNNQSDIKNFLGKKRNEL